MTGTPDISQKSNIRITQIIIITAFFISCLLKSMPQIKPGRCRILFMTFQRNRSLAKFCIYRLNRHFQNSASQTLSPIVPVQDKTHKSVKRLFLHFRRISLPFKSFSKKDHPNISMMIFYCKRMAYTPVKNTVIRNIHNRVHSIDKFFANVISVNQPYFTDIVMR